MSDGQPPIRVQVHTPRLSATAAPAEADRLVVQACIGCGAFELPRECQGACDDRRLELVQSADFEQAREQLASARAAVAELRAVVDRLQTLRPLDGRWEEPYAALQRAARVALGTVAARPEMEPAPRVTSWACRTCGRIEAPQPCVGVCVRKPAEMVPAGDHDAVLEAAALAGAEADAVVPMVRRLAWVRPHPDAYERTLRALASEARALGAAG